MSCITSDLEKQIVFRVKRLMRREHVTFAQAQRISEDRMVDRVCITMTPEEKQALQEHVQGIAKILYRNTPADQLKKLARIEQSVREQMQKHIMPEVGVF